MSGNRRKTTPQTTPNAPLAPGHEDVSARPVIAAKIPEIVARAEPANQAKKTERIGEILRNARLQRGDDLYYIADYLRIKPAFLIALENSQYEEFPADAYVIGFLRSYAELLGLNGKEAVDRYRYEMAGRRKKPVLAMPPPLTEGRAPSALIMVGATVAVLLIYALWYGISSANRTEVSAPPTLPTVQQTVPAPTATDATSAAAGLTAPVTPSTPATTTAPVMPQAAPGILVSGNVPPPTNAMPAAAPELPAPKDAAKPDNGEAPPPEPADDKNAKKQIYGDPNEASQIIIRATQSSWVMVTDADGKAVFDHVLKPGDIYKVPNKPGLSLTTGNGSGIVLSLNGADLPKIASGAPHVVRNIPLDPSRLTTEPSAQ